MKIVINPSDTIVSLKKQFHSHFPNLKIELFNKPSDEDGASKKEMMLDNETLLSGIYSGAATMIEFDEQNTVGEFEKQFLDKLGLHVQVFRKSGKIYLETITTDAWSLLQQNKEGEGHPDSSTAEARDMTDRDKWE